MSASLRHGEHNDCAVESLMLTTGKTYDECHAALKANGRRNRCATHHHTLIAAASDLGFNLKKQYLIHHIEGRKHYTTKTVGDALLSHKPYIIYVHRHFAPFVNGEVMDWTRGRRNRVKFVYRVEKKVRVVK